MLAACLSLTYSNAIPEEKSDFRKLLWALSLSQKSGLLNFVNSPKSMQRSQEGLFLNLQPRHFQKDIWAQLISKLFILSATYIRECKLKSQRIRRKQVRWVSMWWCWAKYYDCLSVLCLFLVQTNIISPLFLVSLIEMPLFLEDKLCNFALGILVTLKWCRGSYFHSFW
jgi:hypothetical protein